MNVEDELQTGDEPETGLEAGAESATDMGDNPEQETESGEVTPEAQEANEPASYTKRIHQKHHELMEERRARLAIEQELERLKQQQQPVDEAPVVPDMPDQYDDNFEEKIRQRDEALAKRIEWDARQQILQEQEQARQQEQAARRQQENVDRLQKFAKRAQELNISNQELNIAAQTVVAYGVSSEVEDMIVDNENGPVLAVHLAENPAELDVMRGMTGVQAGMYIATNILPKLNSAKKQVAPPPPDTLGGGGAPPAERGPRGATYE